MGRSRKPETHNQSYYAGLDLRKPFKGVKMKKILCAVSFLFAVAATFAVPTAHNETHEENWTDMHYIQVPIYKILDSRDAYVVIYAKNKVGVGQTVIPKDWIKGNPENPRKLKIRKIGSGRLKPFMTVVKKGGEFHRVILTVPQSRLDSTWGVVEYSKQIEGADKETLEDLAL